MLALYQKQAGCAPGAGRRLPATLAPLATPVQVGQHVTAGTSVAEVVQLDKLKAALQIAETQARDIQIGLAGLYRYAQRRHSRPRYPN